MSTEPLCAHCGESLDGECCPYPDARGYAAPVHRDCEIALLLAVPPEPRRLCDDDTEEHEIPALDTEEEERMGVGHGR